MATDGRFVMIVDDLCHSFQIGWRGGWDPEEMLPRYLQDLEWFGLVPDEVHFSSENAERHAWAAEKLGYRAYPKVGSQPYWANTRKMVWDPDNLGDRPTPELADAEGPIDALGVAWHPYYMTCCLVDDHDFGITAWVAGRDLMPMWAWCLDGYARLGFAPPDIFWHRCLKLSMAAEKISKTSATQRTVRNYRAAGYEPDRILETIAECNVRSWIAGHEYIIIPKNVLTLDGGKPRYLRWRNRGMEEIIAGQVPPEPPPEQWRVVAKHRARLRDETRIRIA